MKIEDFGALFLYTLLHKTGSYEMGCFFGFGVGRMRLLSILRNDGDKYWQPYVHTARLRHHAPQTNDGISDIYNNPTLQVMGAISTL